MLNVRVIYVGSVTTRIGRDADDCLVYVALWGIELSGISSTHPAATRLGVSCPPTRDKTVGQTTVRTANDETLVGQMVLAGKASSQCEGRLGLKNVSV